MALHGVTPTPAPLTEAWVSLGQFKVMTALEACRTAALGGHVAACEDCGHDHIAYNSCRNRHCPKCQGTAAEDWLSARKAELLPVPYYHVVFTLPSLIADIAYQNKATIYDLLFKAAAETLLTIAADPKHLGARIGIISVLHTWGSAMMHHPHVHMIVPGGGLALDGKSWIACKPGFFLPVRVLSMLFRRLMLEKLRTAHEQGKLRFFGDHQRLDNERAFAAYLAPLKKTKWFVYSKEPFKGPAGTLAYLGRYTHRVAIANKRLIKADDNGVTFHYKDYRGGGRFKRKIMTIAPFEFIRRFLIHILPDRFHRIRHYGLFANGQRAANLHRIRALLNAAIRKVPSDKGLATIPYVLLLVSPTEQHLKPHRPWKTPAAKSDQIASPVPISQANPLSHNHELSHPARYHLQIPIETATPGNASSPQSRFPSLRFVRRPASEKHPATTLAGLPTNLFSSSGHGDEPALRKFMTLNGR